MYKFQSIKWTFEKRDIWIGLYWKKHYSGLVNWAYLSFYLCIIPMFPICLVLERRSTYAEEMRVTGGKAFVNRQEG